MKPNNLKAIPYKEMDLTRKWQEYEIAHDLTERGMEKFSADWNELVKGRRKAA